MYLSKILQDTPAQFRADVATEYHKALTYVWGRQDGDGSTEERDTTRSERFAYAYATARRDFLVEYTFTFPNLQDAYETWRRSRVIEPRLLTCGTLGPR